MWSEAESLSAQVLAQLPVFPLPRVVVFPGSTVPLHLFEARYCAMAEHCLANKTPALALTCIRPGCEDAQLGHPPIETIGSVGVIVEHHRRADGTHQVLLQVLARAQLAELPAANWPFRRAQAQLVKHSAKSVSTVELSALYSCVHAVALLLRPHLELRWVLDMGKCPELWVDRVADVFLSDPNQRQAVLASGDLPTRLRLVTKALGTLYAQLHRSS